ncbi:MAG: hypothetical protein Q4C40_03400 [Eubacteriales bacterium]|nr:hypothetical protein [Eubacteriales bacterium]
MKRRLLSLGLAAVVLTGLLTGCGSTRKIVASETYEVDKNPAVTVEGDWIVPGKDRELTFQADGTYTSTISSSMNGKYVYYKDIEGFALADAFDQLTYVVLSDSDGKEQIFSAVLGDVMVGYHNQDQCYYFRKDREIVPETDFLGSWIDASGGKYTMTLQADGTGKLGEADDLRDCTYRYSEDTGYLTITDEDTEQEYAVGMYEGYLFLMTVGNYYSMYLYQPA